MKNTEILDTTLRDGMQAEGISFSVNDKLNILKLLDSLCIDFAEVGTPASNVKDNELFERLPSLELKHVKPVAFSSTCHINTLPESDAALNAAAASGCEYVSVFGKAWLLHVEHILCTTAEENLRIIKESIEFLRNKDKKVFFDAEHFFDGYKDDPAYACKVIETAVSAGAERVVLCDTNGGALPDEVVDIIKECSALLPENFGVHFHNDCGVAVANAVAAVAHGAFHVQGTLNGIGERCGNTNLATLIGNLQLKKNMEVIPPECMQRLSGVCRAVAQISNISTNNMPYISRAAFSHKAGMHVDAVMKTPRSFEHIDPETVGNRRNILISEVSGKSALFSVIKEIAPFVQKSSDITSKIVERVKELEYKGYQYESARASLELIVLKELGIYKPHFCLERFKLITEQEGLSAGLSSAFVKVKVGRQYKIAATESDGPVHALDGALREALYGFFPELENVFLTDYKVRVLDAKSATGSTVRVFVETSDGENSWTTVGVSVDVIEASKQALIDGIEYKLYRGECAK